MNAASQKYAVRKQAGGWHQIAWCFLKASTLHYNTPLNLNSVHPVHCDEHTSAFLRTMTFAIIFKNLSLC